VSATTTAERSAGSIPAASSHNRGWNPSSLSPATRCLARRIKRVRLGQRQSIERGRSLPNRGPRRGYLPGLRNSPTMDGTSQLELLLAEQRSYYRAIADEYEEHAIPGARGGELLAALQAFRPTGSVLELACGRGTWTRHLLRHATRILALDASPEMLAIASTRLRDERVQFIQADVFSWKPEERYDVVFFGFWLSHVPAERFESFWSLVAGCLRPRRPCVLR
jgi:SAM-dependent methyltransferase